jgi:hypothetical protein
MQYTTMLAVVVGLALTEIMTGCEVVIMAAFCTAEDYEISPKFVPYRPSYDELVARIEALEKAGE